MNLGPRTTLRGPAIAVVVPVLSRPQNAEPLADSLTRATTVDYRLVFVCTPGDDAQIEACHGLGDVIVVDWPAGKADWGRKLNHAFRETSEPWLFTGADDLDFHLGWDTAALETAERAGAGVVGTQDGANPQVKIGRHSTHSLVRRSYIDECGGSVGEPGIVIHEGYQHQWSEVELIETAKARGCFAFSHDSHVTHRHPLWHTAPRDSTYEKAMSHAQEDRALFNSRAHLWANEQRSIA